MSEVMESTEDEARWVAVCTRSADADGAFVYAVGTTGVYCRPSCPARRPLRRNVHFFALTAEARAAGYRACKRCRPDEMSSAQTKALAVEAACRTIEAADVPPTLAAIAAAAGMSQHHFHRTFKAHTGLTPKAYADAARVRRTTAALGAGETPTAAAFGSGFGSLSRFYDAAAECLGMSPSALRAGGKGEVIVVAQAPSSLGVVTAAFSRRGIAAVRLTDDFVEGRAGIETLYPHALVVDGGEDFRALVEEIVAVVEEPRLAEELPLDIRGTAFEERVWAALRRIPVGTTATYGEIAAALGRPTAHRAVARACAMNKIAILIPCHRVVRSDGTLAGYRWGVARKEALLRREGAVA
ncbi:bifunctional DNA-binding transcriptional regulator/O6-methylguanine-DNA methyltransferase Ada [Acuticoccus mangrovi]|uniref:methylated-DNA--[protein]-cysteine S-methyltransferase n=1 Tax=Acuticoccus mangrovi TaxID=2796142 RepID=A0A934IS87_9HYPH|nr:bifunctional DNA-binding transcriptional regulator/O6-methylguanine-DNA methyltransferase Ada [Acuticoccus mangrovi]MBJ3777277.1 bifunctional DNA-binding transcriptional regulator/O6-methylguanine-DNA methyltransferase Ada [Acuticoccus mangrovi]